MLTQTAKQLKSGDEFTADEGVTWHKVVDLYKVKNPSGILVTTEDLQKIWLWAEEDVVVRL